MTSVCEPRLVAYRDRCGNCCYRTEYVRAWVSTPTIVATPACCVAATTTPAITLQAEAAKPAAKTVASVR